MKVLAIVLAFGIAFMELAMPFQTVPSYPSTRLLNANPKQPSRSFNNVVYPKLSRSSSSSRTSLSVVSVSALPSIIANSVPSISTSVIKKTILAMAVTLFAVFRRQILWPGSGADKSFPGNPLPQGSNGCPFIGSNLMAGSSSYGTGSMFTKLFKRLGRPKLFRFYFFGMPFVSVTGKQAIQDALKTEFSKVPGTGVGTADMASSFPNYMEIFGDKNILYVNDREKHGFLRRLVGVAMAPNAVSQAVPALEVAANSQIDKVVKAARNNDEITMHKICNDFTLDVAWRQILGLDLKGEEEIDEFHKNVQVWMKGLFNPYYMVPFKVPFLQRTKPYIAMKKMLAQVEKKLETLERDGPDDSTLSKMYFATDEDGTTRLAHDDLIHNANILIVAGSETSSSTLVTSMLLLGLHKDVLRKLQDEQRALISKYGTTEMTKDRLDADCPYLDGFIRETLRIRPITGMEPRQTQETIIMDGQQIPKKNFIFSNIRGTHDQDPSVRVDDSDDHMDLMKGFKPERWLDSSTTPQEWMPFGMGGRRCLGERLALTEMKVFVATFVRKIEDLELVGVSSAEDVKWKKISAIPYPNDGVVIRPKAVDGVVASLPQL